MFKGYFEMFERDRDFSSRDTKEVFWRSAGLDIIIWAVMAILAIIFNDMLIFWGAVAVLYLAVTFSARLALWFRRMHDTGIKGTFSLVILIPVIGAIALLFVFLSDSQPKNNAYGEYQKPKKKAKKK